MGGVFDGEDMLISPIMSLVVLFILMLLMQWAHLAMIVWS